MTYTFPNGSQIEFFGCENAAKVFGPARDILFVNEAQRVPKEVFRQMAVRTRLMLYVDFNPVKVLGTRLFQGARHGGNRQHLQRIIHIWTPEQIEEIERNKAYENWWRIFGLGETGGTEGTGIS